MMAEPKRHRTCRSASSQPAAGGIAARALARAPAALSRRAQPGAARGGGDAGRAGAGAGRRRNRENARADDPHRPHPQPGPGAAERNPGRHLHQQGRARDEGPRRPDGRPGGRGHALARHLPLDRRENPAPPRRDGRPEVELHHPRRRRPDPPDQAAAGSREARREALAGARLRHASSTAGRTAASRPSRCRPAKRPPSPTARARSFTPPIRSG